jgi:UDPglucose 6-dehydrogenase
MLALRARLLAGFGTSRGEQMNIGIIGLGTVGKAVKAFHDSRGDGVWTYDIATDSDGDFRTLDELAEVVFLCLPTPLGANGLLDCKVVTESVCKLNQSHTVIIKSTVMPGTTDALQQAFPQHRLFFVPEFLDAATAVEDYAKPRRSHVVGHPRGCDVEPLAEADQFAYHILPSEDNNATYYWLPARDAEVLKLWTNTYYMIKVVLSNVLYDVGLSQESIDAAHDNPRIGDSHSQVWHRGYRGASGPCLGKDPQAFAKFLRETKGACAHILDHLLTYNANLLMHANPER